MEIAVAETEKARGALPMSADRRREADELDRKALEAGAGFNGQREPADKDVDNPYALLPEKDGEDRPEKQRVAVNVRETPIELMFSRNQISDDEKAAADSFRRHCEATRIGGGVSNPERPPSKGGVSDPLMAVRLDSARALRAAHAILGEIDYWLLYEACTVGRSLGDIAAEVYRVEKGTIGYKREVRHISSRVQEGLRRLVDRNWSEPASAGARNAPSKSSRFYRSFGALATDILPDEEG